MEQTELGATMAGAPAAVAPPGRSLWDVLTRRVWIIVEVAAALFLGAILIGLIQPKVYRATAWLLVTPRQQQKVELPTPVEAWSQVESEIPIHLRLIKRIELAQKVRDALGLNASPVELLRNVNCERISKSKDANLLALSFDDTDPKRAQEIVNKWAELYVEDSRQRGVRSVISALDYVDQQLKTIEAQLQEIESQLARRKEAQQQTGASNTALSRLAQLEVALAENKTKQAAIRAQIEQTKELLAKEPKETEEVEEEPSELVQALRKQLAELYLQRQKMLQGYYEDSPEVKALDKQIEEIEKQLKQIGNMTRASVTKAPNPTYMKLKEALVDLQAQLRSLEAEAASLEKQIAIQRQIVGLVPETEITVARLQRKQKVLEEIHSMLLSRKYELQVQKAMAVPNVQVVEPAERPTKPIKPKIGMLAGIGLLLGILIGLTLAVIVDQIEDTFGSIEEIRAYTGKRILGAVPRVEPNNDGNGRKKKLSIVDMPRSVLANAIQMLGSMVRIELERSNISSIMVTSAGRGEGKSTISANLAMSLAGAGEKVLLVDADLHNPQLHRYFDIPNDKGLSNVLLQQASIEDVVQETGVPGVRLLASGPLPPSPVDLLASDTGEKIIQEINKSADVVIWDTPPTAILPDATVIGRLVGGAIFVVGRNAKRRIVRQVLENFYETGVNVIGIVANEVRPGGGYYYYYYYYYYYRYPYGAEEK